MKSKPNTVAYFTCINFPSAPIIQLYFIRPGNQVFFKLVIFSLYLTVVLVHLTFMFNLLTLLIYICYLNVKEYCYGQQSAGKKSHMYSHNFSRVLYIACCHLFFWPMSKQNSIPLEFRNSLTRKTLRNINQKIL